MKNSPSIDLQDCLLGDEGCRVLVEFLKEHEHSHVSSLNLKANNIGDRGATLLAQFLQGNDSLRKLNLEWNNLGHSEHAIQTLCSAVANHSSLQELDLRNNKLGDQACGPIGELIRHNKTLRKINLSWNEFGTQGGKQLLHGLNGNVTLHFLEVLGTKIADDIKQSINNIQERNRGEASGLGRALKERPFAGVSDENEVPYEILRKEKDFADNLKAKYEAQVIAHQRTEKRLREVDKHMQNEKRKYKATNAELQG